MLIHTLQLKSIHYGHVQRVAVKNKVIVKIIDIWFNIKIFSLMDEKFPQNDNSVPEVEELLLDYWLWRADK